MTKNEFVQLLLKVQAEERAVYEAGHSEYAHADSNAFRNFEGTSGDLNITREQVLWVFLKKHIDGIVAHINGHTSQREDVRGRIKDARMYLGLLWGMLDDKEEQAEAELDRHLVRALSHPTGTNPPDKTARDGHEVLPGPRYSDIVSVPDPGQVRLAFEAGFAWCDIEKPNYWEGTWWMKSPPPELKEGTAEFDAWQKGYKDRAIKAGYVPAEEV